LLSAAAVNLSELHSRVIIYRFIRLFISRAIRNARVLAAIGIITALAGVKYQADRGASSRFFSENVNDVRKVNVRYLPVTIDDRRHARALSSRTDLALARVIADGERERAAKPTEFLNSQLRSDSADPSHPPFLPSPSARVSRRIDESSRSGASAYPHSRHRNSRTSPLPPRINSAFTLSYAGAR